MDSMPLCFPCGLCCDGTLFADVRLRREDVSRLPSRLPNAVARGNSRTFKLPQPCFAWTRGLCSIYADRPQHCLKFDCDLLKKAQAGEVSHRAALQIIRKCRSKADEVKQRLRELGSRDETACVTNRFRALTKLAESGRLGRKRAPEFADLTVAIQELHCLLAEHIYPV